MRVSTDPIDLTEDVLSPDTPTPPIRIIRTDADHEHVIQVLSGDPNQDDTRSQWQWFRLPNGDLILGVFPQGKTYLDVVDEIRWPDDPESDDLQPLEQTDRDNISLRLMYLDRTLKFYHPHNLGLDPDALKDKVVQSPGPDDSVLHLLVEESTYDQSYEFSLHESLASAYDYQVTQEYVEDWEPVAVVDLDTGWVTELTRDVTYTVRPRAQGDL